MINQRKSRSKTNQPVGTIITYRGKKLEIKRVTGSIGSECRHCYFNKSCDDIPCTNNTRTDKALVYFKLIK